VVCCFFASPYGGALVRRSVPTRRSSDLETSEDCSDEALENEGLGSISEQILDARPDVTLGGGAASFAQTATAGDWKDETLLQQRSEEHTSELQSRFDLVCRLLLEKKREP